MKTFKTHFSRNNLTGNTRFRLRSQCTSPFKKTSSRILKKRDTKSHRMANTSHIWLRMKTA